METMEAVIKPLKNMTKTKIDNVINKELQMKQLQKSLEKEKRHQWKNARKKLFIKKQKKYSQLNATHNTTKI